MISQKGRISERKVFAYLQGLGRRKNYAGHFTKKICKESPINIDNGSGKIIDDLGYLLFKEYRTEQ